VICADELGPVTPRTFTPAPGWSPSGHRIKAPLEYSRGPGKTWVYGALRIADGHALTMTAPSRDSACYQRFLQQVEDVHPNGQIVIVTDNLSSHNSTSTRQWLQGHPRIRQMFILIGACWLNLQEGLWRIFRKAGTGTTQTGDRRERRHPADSPHGLGLIISVSTAHMINPRPLCCPPNTKTPGQLNEPTEGGG
jgi:hypothetical protein